MLGVKEQYRVVLVCNIPRREGRRVWVDTQYLSPFFLHAPQEINGRTCKLEELMRICGAAHTCKVVDSLLGGDYLDSDSSAWN